MYHDDVPVSTSSITVANSLIFLLFAAHNRIHHEQATFNARITLTDNTFIAILPTDVTCLTELYMLPEYTLSIDFKRQILKETIMKVGKFT